MHHIGLKRGAVALFPYDITWPQLFEAEKIQLLTTLQGVILEVEHIGSTSVPGLAAKPLIDMMASVEHLSNYRQAIAPLEALGYEFMPERIFDDRVFFPKGPREQRIFHLSLVEKGSQQWLQSLLFRDYLRTRPEKRDEYQRLKQELARSFADNRERYTSGKADFIHSVLELAAK